jgi:hypothetical protein
MSTIHVRRRIDSETLHLPELRPLLGKTVDITIVEETTQRAATDADWEAFFRKYGTDLIDPDVFVTYRDFDREHNLPPEL